MYLNPPSSRYQWTSRSLIFTSYLDPAIPPNYIRQASLTSFGKSQMLSKLQNTLYTWNRCAVKTSLGFFFFFSLNNLLTLLWVMSVYIVCVKGIRVTFKILQAKSFMSTSRDGLSREVLVK